MMFGGTGGGRRNRSFETHFAVFSAAMKERNNLEEGDKVLLPPSAFDQLSRMEVDYPMLFEITNENLGRSTHCGVLEFIAEEGRCYMPYWMMQNLIVEEGQIIKVKNVSLSKCTFVKFKPQHVDFLDITNPRAVLEYTLRKYTCLTTGDMICLPYAGKNYYIEVTDVQPNGKASIIETDCNVDFEPPVGYVEPSVAAKSGSATGSAASSVRNSRSNSVVSDSGAVVDSGRVVQKARVEDEKKDETVFEAFKGNAQRIDGKALKAAGDGEKESAETEKDSGVVATPTPTVSRLVPQRVSKIGGKFSSKVKNAAAFTGSGNKMT